MSDRKRAFDMTIDIAASPEEVWQAWTEPGELVRWFPLDAEVTPGPGGSTRWSWGGAWVWETRIDAWEPRRRLRLVQDDYPICDGEGQPIGGRGEEPVPVALEITLEGRGGTTRLRLVHSGFGSGGAWDDEFDGISAGWQFELRSLRHYLTRHRGRDRHAGWARLTTHLPREAAWSRLLGPGGFPVEAGTLREGADYVVRTDAGEVFSGSILLHVADAELAGTAREFGDGIFRLGVYRAAGQTGVTAWLATYGPDTESARTFEPAAQARLERLFASERAGIVADAATA